MELFSHYSAFRAPGYLLKLKELGIDANKSQLMLLQVGGLLAKEGAKENVKYTTLMPIFDKEQTSAIRKESASFADSIYNIIEPDIRKLVNEFYKKGWQDQVYNLVFSYLLDGYIWDEDKLTPSNDALSSFGSEISSAGQPRIKNPELIKLLSKWSLTDTLGNVTVPVLYPGSKDTIDILTDKITGNISAAVKKYCHDFASRYGLKNAKEAEIIFYHEVMWDLLARLENTGVISMPALLRGEECGKEKFNTITFIVIENK